MEFLKRLEETDDSKVVKKQLGFLGEANHIRMLKGLEFDNNVVLSVQASYGHYCTPRETVNLYNYSRMELGLLQNGEFVTVSSLLPEFSRLKEIEEYEDTVYGYVPVDLIEDLYQSLKETYSLVKEN